MAKQTGNDTDRRAEAVRKLKYELGDLTYKMGKQRQKYEQELKALQALERLVNEKATEIEKLLDG